MKSRSLILVDLRKSKICGKSHVSFFNLLRRRPYNLQVVLDLMVWPIFVCETCLLSVHAHKKLCYLLKYYTSCNITTDMTVKSD